MVAMKFKKGYIPWNKGIKTGIIPKSAFKKGIISFRKGKYYIPREIRYCACDCGKTFKCKINSKKRFINTHYQKKFFIIPSEKVINNLIKYVKENIKGFPLSINQKLKIGRGNYGKRRSLKTREKQSNAKKGKPLNHPVNCQCFGCKAKRGEYKKENHPQWIKNRDLLKYGDDFNKLLKESIRKRDTFICQLCSIPEKNLKQKLHAHHIDYNKKNNDTSNLISLCNSCHVKTNYNREYWKELFNGKNYINKT